MKMEWLIKAFIRARKSTIKRVLDLTEEQLDLHSADGVSIRDLSWHIALCDNTALKPFQTDLEYDSHLYAGLGKGKKKEEILEYLDTQLKRKCEIILKNINRLSEKTDHLSYGKIMIGEAILCSGIDHEAHHRGQISLIRRDNGI
jgi:uncharacterized damage-inducible protein DinB